MQRPANTGSPRRRHVARRSPSEVGESVEEVIRSRGGGWLLFVDFSKAYDSVNRAKLLLILRRMGFNKEFIALVKTALRSYNVFSESLGVNIRVERGVPQGWSLSCVLFNLVLDPKTAPPLEAQRSVIPLADIDDWSVRTRRFI